MGEPKIKISFLEIAKQNMQRAEFGTVLMGIKDVVGDVFTVLNENDIPSTLSDFNKEQIKICLLGNQTAPKKIIVYTMDKDAADISDEYASFINYAKTCVYNILVIPTVKTDNQVEAIKAYILSEMALDEPHNVMAVLPEVTSPNCENIINNYIEGYSHNALYTATVGKYTAEEYCARIAGLVAGTSFKKSITNVILSDLYDCNRMTQTERDTAVDAGKLVAKYDGTHVKISRGVTSFTTTTDTKGESFKKIRLVTIMHVLSDSLHDALEEYKGQITGKYDNKVMLLSLINKFLLDQVKDDLIESGEAQLDLEATKAYLISKDKDISDMTDKQIIESNTGSNFWATINCVLLDTLEDFEIKCYI